MLLVYSFTKIGYWRFLLLSQPQVPLQYRHMFKWSNIDGMLFNFISKDKLIINNTY